MWYVSEQLTGIKDGGGMEAAFCTVMYFNSLIWLLNGGKIVKLLHEHIEKREEQTLQDNRQKPAW